MKFYSWGPKLNSIPAIINKAQNGLTEMLFFLFHKKISRCWVYIEILVMVLEQNWFACCRDLDPFPYLFSGFGNCHNWVKLPSVGFFADRNMSIRQRDSFKNVVGTDGALKFDIFYNCHYCSAWAICCLHFITNYYTILFLSDFDAWFFFL